MKRTIIRFVCVGLLTTGISYIALTGLMHLGVHYLVAGTVSWAASVCVSFVLNRFYTFGLRTRERRGRDMVVFLVGAVLQLVLALAIYAALFDLLGVSPSVAFAINLLATTLFSFIFMKWITFRPIAAAPASGD